VSSRPGLLPRLGCAPGAGLRSFGRGADRWTAAGDGGPTVVAETVTDTMVGTVSDDDEGQAVARVVGRRCGSRICLVRAIASLRSFGWR
jgi:hypothetical protein